MNTINKAGFRISGPLGFKCGAGAPRLKNYLRQDIKKICCFLVELCTKKQHPNKVKTSHLK